MLDLVGLGSHEVANRMLQMKHALYPADMALVVSHSDVKVIAIYETWFRHGVPPSWVKVGELTLLRKPVEVAGGTVSFFAPSPELADELTRHLQSFAGSLPDSDRIHLVQAPTPSRANVP